MSLIDSTRRHLLLPLPREMDPGARFLSVPQPQKLNTSTFHDAVNFVKVFIAFMLGLFLNSCLARWYNIIAAVTDLFLCIKKARAGTHS